MPAGLRLLFDENLSEALLGALADCFPDALHVRRLGAGGSPDTAIWRLALAHECLLVTRDEDFLRLSVLHGPPPKVVWVALGNCSNAEVAALLRTRALDIAAFAEQEEAGFLVLKR